jgi:GT2 family glycosyltransferase
VVYVWQHHADAPRFFTTNNLAVPAQRFLKCGGLNPLFRISEDREFCDRWVHKGGRLKYVPEAVVFHKHDLSFRAFVRQHFSYGGGGHRFYWLRAQRGLGTPASGSAFLHAPAACNGERDRIAGGF